MNNIFTPEVIAAIVGALVTAILAYVFYLYKTRKGNRVIFGKTIVYSLISVSDLIKQNISITYKSKPLESLILYEFFISNDGDKDIGNFETTIHFETGKPDSILEHEVFDNLKKTNVKVDKTTSGKEFDEYDVTITRPFLNSIKKFKEEKVFVRFYTDSPLSFYIMGGGEGWYATLYDYRNSELATDKLKNWLINMGGLLMMLFTFTIISFFYTNIFPREIIIAVIIGIILALGGYIIYSYTHILRIFGYRKNKKSP